jgi:hypothetical protein
VVSAVDLAVQARIAAARARVARQRAERAAHRRRRAYGLVQRHAAKLRHLDARDAIEATPNPQETDQP